jgi:hypothetical protein
MEEYLNQLIVDPHNRTLYFAVLLVVVLLLVWLIYNKNCGSERFLGDGTVMSAAPYTSGATMRRLGQDFSSTNQGEYTTVHNDELKELVPGLIKGPSVSSAAVPAVAKAAAANMPKKEWLVNERGFPDFWEIGSELSAYKDDVSAGFQSDVASGNTSSDSSSAVPAAATPATPVVAVASAPNGQVVATASAPAGTPAVAAAAPVTVVASTPAAAAAGATQEYFKNWKKWFGKERMLDAYDHAVLRSQGKVF